MLKFIKHICILGLTLTLSGCAADRDESRDAIAVSFEPQAWMVRQIAGDDLDVITLLPAGSDPEVYQPTISTMKSLGNASAYFTLGTPGFEEALTQNISRNFPNLKIIDSAAGIDKLCGSHNSSGINDDHAHSKDFDPHLLSSISNSIIIAGNITESLASLYPENASRYREAGKTLKLKLTALDDSIKNMNLRGNSVVIRHPSLSYYARDYGVDQIALNDVGKEISPIQLKKRIDSTAASQPVLMVVEKEHASASDYEIASQLEVDTIQVALNTSSWLNDLMRISNEINRD